MPFVELRSGVKLHYLRVGDGPHLVMIHGLTGNLAVWHLKMVPLLRDRFNVLTYDMRGHGRSDHPPSGYTSDDMAGDLEGVLDALDIDQCDIVGHSYGADAAMYFAHQHPERVRKILAVEAGLAALIHQRKREDWEGWEYWAQALERFGIDVPREKRSDFDYMIRMMLQVPKLWGPAQGRARKAEPILRLLATTAVKDYEIVGSLPLDQVREITTPIHLVYGDKSSFLGTYRFLMDELPNATSTLLDLADWSHFGVMEQPEELVRIIYEFIGPSRHAGAPGPELVAG